MEHMTEVLRALAVANIDKIKKETLQKIDDLIQRQALSSGDDFRKIGLQIHQLRQSLIPPEERIKTQLRKNIIERRKLR